MSVLNVAIAPNLNFYKDTGENMSDFLSAAEVAKRLNVTPRTIVRWIEAGHFPGAIKVNPYAKNSPFIIPKTSVASFEEKRNQGVVQPVNNN